MTDDGLRVLAAALARIELQQAQLLAAVEALQVRLAPAEDRADLLEALDSYFGGAPFTAGTVLLAAEERGELQDVLAGLVDYQLPPHGRAVQLGRLLARLPGLQRVGGRRGAVLWRVG